MALGRPAMVIAGVQQVEAGVGLGVAVVTAGHGQRHSYHQGQGEGNLKGGNKPAALDSVANGLLRKAHNMSH